MSLPPPVESLRELWAKTPLVVLATAIRADPAQVREGFVVQYQSFQVDEVLKADTELAQGRKIRVEHVGGTAVVNGQEFVTHAPDRPPLRPGEQAVLFLTPTGDGVFVIRQARAGVYVVTNVQEGTIEISEAASHLVELSGRRGVGKHDLLRLLRGFSTVR